MKVRSAFMTFFNITMIVLSKSLGPIDRKFHGHGENDGYVVCVFLCNKKSKENYMSTVSINYVRFKE